MAIRDPIIDGTRFSRLVTLSSKKVGRRTWYKCQCDCGTIKEVRSFNLKNGATRSCGCLMRENLVALAVKQTKHGHASYLKASPTYVAWVHLVRRCTKKTDAAWKHYGGRGIRVCERWLMFENFLADMGEKPAGLTLDRFPNNNGDYEPTNCRWATAEQQQNNKRNTRLVTIDGETKSLAQWARVVGITKGSMYARAAKHGEEAAVRLGPRSMA